MYIILRYYEYNVYVHDINVLMSPDGIQCFMSLVFHSVIRIIFYTILISITLLYSHVVNA